MKSYIRLTGQCSVGGTLGLEQYGTKKTMSSVVAYRNDHCPLSWYEFATLSENVEVILVMPKHHNLLYIK